MTKQITYNIADIFESLADAIGDRTALVSGSVRRTYAELDRRANQLAHFLEARGVKPGQHVGVYMYNGHEFVEAMLAILKLRAVPININYRYAAPELRYMFKDADIVALFAQRCFLPIVHGAVQGEKDLLLHTVVFADDDASVPLEVEAIEYETALAQGSPERGFGPRSSDDIYIVYTGGTTGWPKGVMWRHGDLFYAGLQGGAPGFDPIPTPEGVAERVVAEPECAMNMLPAAPFVHGAAQFTAWIGFFTGGKLVLQAGKSFDARRIWQLVEEEGVTTILIVGDAMAIPLLEELEKHPYNTESLLTIASSGAILSPSVKARLQERLESTMIINNFGATEVGHQGTAMGDETGRDGRPSFYMDENSAVFDDDWKPVEPGSGKLGKIARKGRIPVGYYKDPEKTAERFLTIDGVRWVVPGDYATVEEDGRITLYGRGSNCINTGGEKVFPEEVEEALKSHPDVRDALVVGVADPRWMQRVAAVVEPKPGKKLNLAELQRHCREVIAGYKVPRQLTLVDTVARFPTGKPDYTWAKQQAELAQEKDG